MPEPIQVITADYVVSSVEYLIPLTNQIPDDALLQIAQSLIDEYGDDIENLGKIKCEFLKLVGLQNAVLDSAVDGKGRVSEKLGDHSISQQGSGMDWDAYVKRVNDDLCPMFGVQNHVAFGAVVHSSPKKRIIKPSCQVYESKLRV